MKTWLRLFLTGLFTFSLWPANQPTAHAATIQIYRTISKCEFRSAMNKLWEDHVIWTRVVIMSSLSDLPDKGVATQRLLKNQVDIGNAVKTFYGTAAGDQLSALLKEHIAIGADVIAAAKANNSRELEAANARWQTNADKIALFLNLANPRNWPVDHMKMMMREHLSLTTAEVVTRLQGNWAADVEAFDKVHTQILGMSKMLSNGIIKQFPRRFSFCN